MSNLHRTQLRIQRIVDGPDGLFVEATLAGWRPHRTVLLEAAVFPPDLVELFETSPGPDEATLYVHATANLAAQSSLDLELAGPWELLKVRFRSEDLTAGDLGVEVLEEYRFDTAGFPV